MRARSFHVGPNGWAGGPRGLVSGGWGGGGGQAKATLANGMRAYAIGGPGNRGGNAVVKGLQPGCQLFNEGVMRGGGVLFGSFADAVGSPGGGVFNGDAQADGGPGGSGGSVFSSDCAAVIAGTIGVASGGNGGPADAQGQRTKARGGPGGPTGISARGAPPGGRSCAVGLDGTDPTGPARCRGRKGW